MNWFTASLLFEATHSDSSVARALWEERIVLIRAESVEVAQHLAQELGVSREQSYPAQGQDVVTWKFRRVERVYEVQAEAPDAGVELFSRYLRAEEVESLLTPFGDTE